MTACIQTERKRSGKKSLMERERSGERPVKIMVERERSAERVLNERELSGERDTLKIDFSAER